MVSPHYPKHEASCQEREAQEKDEWVSGRNGRGQQRCIVAEPEADQLSRGNGQHIASYQQCKPDGSMFNELPPDTVPGYVGSEAVRRIVSRP